MEFKVGDKVRFIKTENNPYEGLCGLKSNAIYTIVELIGSSYIRLACCCLNIYYDRLEKVEDMEKFKFGDEVCAVTQLGYKSGKMYYVAECEGQLAYQYLCSQCNPNKLGKDGFREFVVSGYNNIEHWEEPPKEYSMQEIANALKIDVKNLRIKK